MIPPVACRSKPNPSGGPDSPLPERRVPDHPTMTEPATPLPIPGFSDPFSSLTHLAGAGVFAVLAVPLVMRGRGHAGRMTALAIFAFAVVAQLALSGVFHLLAPDTTGRAVLKRLDHAAIFVLIAATFTPVHAILFRGPWRWGMLSGIWTAAVTGLTLKTVFFDSLPEWLGLALYLGLGWMGGLSMFALARRYGLRFIRLLVAGGVAYTVGAVIDFAGAPPLIPGVIAGHELFHVAVLAGVSLHWAFIRGFADGTLPQAPPSGDPGPADGS
jgi:channel protein (hemolysin III family)